MIPKQVLAALIFNLQLSQVHRNSQYNGFVIPPVIKGAK